ncbi:3707_t:CDS:2 [Ambispora gerdemannii]|uniref:3707_t:CDS:1 n=1 Tax=Ambispora gerdemannii TaxID=144530 RepID=A0A9N8YKX1_9GLOM|nr:3707_t:CDS:2 [Ambispora gerdemannii]
MASWEYPKHKEFPKLPEDLSKIDPSDKQAVLDAREAFIRERWIKVMETKLLRKQLVLCYKREGVNHFKNCREIAEKYLKSLKEVQNWNTHI